MTTRATRLLQRSKRLARKAAQRLTPPRRGSIENYREDFPASAEAFENFLRKAHFPETPPHGPPVATVIAPMLGTPAPWHFAAMALGLKARGRNVILIYDDIPFDYPTGIKYYYLQKPIVERVLAQLGSRFQIVRLSEYAPQPLREGDAAHLDWLVEQNLVWGLLAGSPTPEQRAEGARVRGILQEHLQHAYALFAALPLEYLLLVGGVVGPSASFYRAARAHGVRFATVDSAFGAVFVAQNGAASYQPDIPEAFRQFLEYPRAQIEFAVTQAKQDFEKRVLGQDQNHFQLQPKTGDHTHGTDVVIPLNVEWDTSALARHFIFQNSAEWLCETITLILGLGKSVTVRQHPAERHGFARARFDSRALVQETFGDNPAVKYVAAADPTNTYDLMDTASLVLPLVSTIGIEAAALGKQVIVVGNSYYAGLGFVYAPQTRADYFETIRRALSGTLPPSENQRERAWIAYYLTQLCGRTVTDFTAQPPDFWKWVKWSPRRLWQDEVYQDILTALDEKRLLPLLNHARLWRDSLER